MAPGLICEGYWQVNSRRSIFRIADPNFVENYGFFHTVNILTRCNHILDIFVINRRTLIQSYEVLPGISDHEVVHVVSAILYFCGRQKPRRILLWHKADFEIIKAIS